MILPDEGAPLGRLSTVERFNFDSLFRSREQIAEELGTLADPLTSHCHRCGQLKPLHQLRAVVLSIEPVRRVRLACVAEAGCLPDKPRPRPAAGGGTRRQRRNLKDTAPREGVPYEATVRSRRAAGGE